MDKKKKLVLAAVLLIVFALVKVVALVLWQDGGDEVQQVGKCDALAGCTLPNGAKVQFTRFKKAKDPFNVELTGVPNDVQNVFLSFKMKEMDMGFNRFQLKKQGDGSWKTEQVRLPMCMEGRHNYLADISFDGKVFETGFTSD